MDVPDRSTYESRLAAKMLTPGAAYRWPTGPHGTALALARPGTARQGTARLGTVEDPCRAC